jgi:hypothetical protein
MLATFGHFGRLKYALLSSESSFKQLLIFARAKKKVRFAATQHEEAIVLTDPDPHLPVDICKALACPSPRPESRLVFRLDEKSLLYGTTCTEPDAEVHITKDCISLNHLLDNTCRSHCQSIELCKDDCLPLAVIIASSLLQLHATPWFPVDLCARSIYFAGLLNEQHSVDVRYPYLTSKIGEQAQSSETPPTAGYLPELIALGIILLELSEKRLISHWYEHKFGTSLPGDLLGRATAAWKWYEEGPYERMSPRYAEAFKLCMNVHFLCAIPPPKMTLSDERFREAVYRKIVLRLQETDEEYRKALTGATLDCF